MRYLSSSLENAIIEFSKLPGIGRKTAQRLVFYLLKRPQNEINMLTNALIMLKEKVRFCSQCFNLAEEELCGICSNPKRDSSVVCVVEEPNDIFAIEKTSEYHGMYHVLGGALSPLDGISPNDLKIDELAKRIANGIQEIILATNPNTEGEATAVYIHNQMQSPDLKITRLARGLPVGGDLEFTDEVTLSRALSGRVLW